MITFRYQTGGAEEPPALVVHMTPDSVLKEVGYKEWMERFVFSSFFLLLKPQSFLLYLTLSVLPRFPSTTEHLIINEHASSAHNIRSHKIQAQLNMIHPEIFPELKSYKTKVTRLTVYNPAASTDGTSNTLSLCFILYYNIKAGVELMHMPHYQ